MKIRFLNKVVDNKKFDYTPMYYDERKERLQKKKRQYEILQDSTVSSDEKREFIKENMRENWSRAHVRHTGNKSANMRTLILILAILALGYFIFNGLDDVETVVNRLW